MQRPRTPAILALLRLGLKKGFVSQVATGLGTHQHVPVSVKLHSTYKDYNRDPEIRTAQSIPHLNTMFAKRTHH